jgi:cytochrome c peroxidase
LKQVEVPLKKHKLLQIATAIMVAFVALYSCSKDGGFLKPKPYVLSLPAKSVPLNMPIPADNPLTEQGVQLGRLLFYDPILSIDSTISCSSCHHQEFAFSDGGNKYSKGVNGTLGIRHAMPLFNLGYDPSFFWDGRERSLEDQALKPIEDALEMKSSVDLVLKKLNALPRYKAAFFEAFGVVEITRSELAKAISQFERTIISGNSKYDKWIRGEATLDSMEMLGRNLFTDEAKGDCTHCHSLGSLFSDFNFKNNGLDVVPADSGRYYVTKLAADIGKFKSPSLRNIALTAPYMHDGRFATLDDVLKHYNIGFKNPPNLDVNMAKHVKARMTVPETKAIIAFLRTLTDSTLITNPAYSNPY